MDGEYWQIIVQGMYFDGDNLLDGDKIIPLKTDREKKLLKMLLKNRGKTLTYQEMYEKVFAGRAYDVNKPEQSISRIKGKMPKALTDKFIKVRNVGYGLPPLNTFCLDPQYTVAKQNAAEVFAPCENNIRQDMALDDMRKRAFMREPYVFAITGQPGMGKTELAKAFAAECCLGKDIPYRLKYENIILTTYQKDGLAATIRNLPIEGICDEKDLEQKIWDGLRSLKKPKLLVIDNADIDPDHEGWDEKIYSDLKKTGFHILFTSRRDMHDLFKINSLQILPIETDCLITLFYNISGERLDGTQKETLKVLIEEYLQNNVYLVTLIAGLMESVTLETLADAFGVTGRLGKVDALTDGHKDGRKQKPDTLTGHFAKLYHMSDMTPSEKRLMLNLALLPADGMNGEEFYQRAFDKQDQKQAKQEFRYLRDKYWVIQNNRKVFLHPMVREVILAEMEENYNKDIHIYLQNVADSMNHTHYSPKLLQALKYGLDAFEAVKIREIKSFEAAQVAAQIASVYDTLTEKQNANKYGTEAIHRMDAQDQAVLSGEDLFRLAQCYNVAGYAVLHGKNTDTAKHALMEAEEILKNLLDSSLTKEKTEAVMLLRSKVSGNLAACFHEEKEYAKSINMHKEALQYRLDINRLSDGKYTDMVASAYKNVATEYFYLSRTEDQKLNLEKSYENHCKAVALYEELGLEYKLEWCVAVNRKVGTRLYMLETGIFSDRTLLVQDLETMVSVSSYLCSIDPVKDELKNCLQNVVRIMKLMEDKDAFNDAASKVMRLAETLPQDVQTDLQEWLTFIRESI